MTTAIEIKNPYGYYLIVLESLQFQEAEAFSKSLGGNLVELETYQESDLLWKTISSEDVLAELKPLWDSTTASDGGSVPYLWVGGDDKNTVSSRSSEIWNWQWLTSGEEISKDRQEWGNGFFGSEPDIMIAALDENNLLGLGSAMHHAQLSVAKWNVLNSARAGLKSMEHWYGLPEALFEDKTVQNYPYDYNYSNEQHRFEEAGKLWEQAAKPNSDHWNNVMNELISLDFTLDPTFNIYEASRDLQRARRAEWHEEYTLPSLWEFYQPSRISHGSYWHYWGTEQEVAWKKNFNLWMNFVNEYKNRGGRVTAGSDSGFIFQLYGFAFIRELELLREAGFHPIEVIMAATLNGAEALGMENEIGSIEIGKKADMLIVEENPLQNLKVLYGTGAIKLNTNNEVVRVGGVKYTIKDGIVYDSKLLLEDVKKMVQKSKDELNYEIYQPGEKKDLVKKGNKNID